MPPTVHPGELVVEWLASNNKTQRELAADMGISASYVSDLCRGKRGISGRIALRLAKATGMSAALTVTMQAQHDLAELRKSSR